jgi:hypothetical protein
MTIINCTPHAINIFWADDVEWRPEIRKYILRESVDVIPFRIYQPSGIMLSANMVVIDKEPIDGIPTVQTSATSVDDPPEADYIIVSRLYAAAAIGKYNNMLVVHDPVYRIDPDGNTTVVGCLGFERI